jgi:cytochrome c-type biogenesis protein CcmH
VRLDARHVERRDRAQDEGEFVAEFGERVLADPPRRGFHLLAWLLPLVGGALALVVVAAVARQWRRAGAAEPEQPLDPELERRLDDELDRFDE